MENFQAEKSRLEEQLPHLSGQTVEQAVAAVSDFINSSPSTSRESAEKFRSVISPLIEYVRAALQCIVRRTRIPENITPEQGQEIARLWNDEVARYGFRFQVPRSQVVGNLAYTRSGEKQASGDRKFSFIVKGVENSHHISRTLGYDLSTIEVVPMQLDGRRHRNDKES